MMHGDDLHKRLTSSVSFVPEPTNQGTYQWTLRDRFHAIPAAAITAVSISLPVFVLVHEIHQ